MTGKELIIYILQHDLEDEEIFKDGTIVGFASEEEAAVTHNVGVQTIRTAYELGLLQGFRIGEKVFLLK